MRFSNLLQWIASIDHRPKLSRIHQILQERQIARAYLRQAVARPCLVTPRYHHFHHATEAEAIDKNFAVHLPVLDRMFGTQFLPGSRWPGAYGVSDGPVARTYLAQILDPFRSR